MDGVAAVLGRVRRPEAASRTTGQRHDLPPIQHWAVRRWPRLAAGAMTLAIGASFAGCGGRGDPDRVHGLSGSVGGPWSLLALTEDATGTERAEPTTS